MTTVIVILSIAAYTTVFSTEGLIAPCAFELPNLGIKDYDWRYCPSNLYAGTVSYFINLSG